MRKTTFNVPAETKPGRLDAFIASNSNLTRSFIQKLIRQGLITVNSRKEKPGCRVKGGDRIDMDVPEQPESSLVPEDIPVDVLWEDEHIIIVNKPPHMVIYPAAGNRSGTLMNALVSRCKKLSSVGAPLRPGVVHRLDKDTSGLLVIAKDDMAHHELARQFKDREIEKHYLALLYGSLKADQGEISAAIGRSVSDRKKMSTITKAGKEAITRFKVMERYKTATLADIRIITGRTHQIRVHFASLGHTVLGDKIYGKKTSLRLGPLTLNFSRQMLHAHSLKFKHPATGEIVEFIAPMPEDMKEAIKAITQSSLT